MFDRELTPLSTSIKHPMQFLDYAVWGPKETQLAFVYEHNLYYKSSVNDPPVQLTRNGNLTTIRNGVPDWLYEEEIFGEEKALWWSTNGSRLCFAKFDDTQVDIIDYQIYDDLLPRTASVRYPRVSCFWGKLFNLCLILYLLLSFFYFNRNHLPEAIVISINSLTILSYSIGKVKQGKLERELIACG